MTSEKSIAALELQPHREAGCCREAMSWIVAPAFKLARFEVAERGWAPGQG